MSGIQTLMDFHFTANFIFKEEVWILLQLGVIFCSRSFLVMQPVLEIDFQ